jgi:hypothetical protein
MSKSAPKNEIGKVTFDISPEALQQIISSGRLTEFASKAAAHAAFQINAQIVDLVSQAALNKSGLSSGVSVGFSAVFEGGDFGTVGPRGPRGPLPHHGTVFGDSQLSQVIAITAKSR